MRAAVIDIGTNTIKLVVGETDSAGTVAVVHESISAPRLGEGIGAGRELNAQAIDRTILALQDHLQTAHDLAATHLRLLATSATREATNSEDFLRRARAELGVDVEIVSGEEEGRLSFASVALERVLDVGKGPFAVVDVGGGSTEIAVGDRHRMIRCVSLPIGAVRLHERFLRRDPSTSDDLACARAHLNGLIRDAAPGVENATVVGVGGSAVNLARIIRRVPPENSPEVHGATVSRAETAEIIGVLAARTVEQRRTLIGLDPDRADIILAGIVILDCVLAAYGRSEMVVSTRGLRYGALYEMLLEKGDTK